MIEESPYSVFDSGCEIITNTVNCQGVMGAGLALEFKLRYPELFEDYAERCKRREVRPGVPYLYEKSVPRALNFPTKNAWRLPSKMEWILNGLNIIVQKAPQWNITSIALPRLGSSHGGLEWPDVRAKIEEKLNDAPFRVVVSLDEKPHPEGLESRILTALNSGRIEDIEKLGVPTSAATRVHAAAPFRRVRDVLDVDRVGKSTYEKLFAAFTRKAVNTGQTRLPLD